MSEGSYYLTRDVTLSGDGSQIKVTGTVYLCLNGHSITGTANYGIFRIGEGGVLNICDCSVGQTGKITEKESHNPIFIHSGGVQPLQRHYSIQHNRRGHQLQSERQRPHI